MKKFILAFSLIFSLFGGSQIFAQPLQAGSIAFVAFQKDQPISFAFVTLVQLDPFTEISFTDNKWGYNHLLETEQTVIWTSPDTILPVGTFVKLRDNGSNMTVEGPGTAIGRLYIMMGQGDQILAYHGPSTSPSFLAGISTNSWMPVCDSLPYFQFRTCLPPPLVNGLTAISFTGSMAYNVQNGYLAITPFDASGPEMLGIINNINYWYLSNGEDAQYFNWPNWNSGATQAFASPIQFDPAFSNSTITEGGSLGTITLKIDPPQFTPQTVILNILEFPGITASDYATNPPSVNGSLSIDIPANTASVSFSVQALMDGVAEADEIITFTIAGTSGGLYQGSPSSFPVTIINTDENFSQIEFAQDTVVVNEGGPAAIVFMNIGPVNPTAFTVIVNSTNGAGISSDYFTTPTAFNGQLLLQTTPNSNNMSFSVTAFDDTQIEADEYVSFTITLISPAGLQIGNQSTVVVNIRDNDNIPQFIVPNLMLNELNAFNVDFPDENDQLDNWIELYNADTVSVNFAGYHITNNIDAPTLFTFPPVSSQTTMAPGSFKVLWADQSTSQGPLHLNFTLSQTGGFVALFAPDGDILMDAINYPQMENGRSFGRYLDGNANWKLMFFPTPGAPNSDSIPSSIFTPGSEIRTQQLSLFPNPSTDILNVVKTGKPHLGKCSIKVMDMQGRELVIEHSEINKGKSWTFNTEKLAHGCYIIVITSGEAVSSAMFNKQ